MEFNIFYANEVDLLGNDVIYKRYDTFLEAQWNYLVNFVEEFL
jgi:hypothetical protein